MVNDRELICPQSTLEKPLLQEFSFASIAIATVTNAGHGPNNEDAAAAFCFGQQTGLAVVADGAGGLPAGAAAAQQIISILKRTANSFKRNPARSIRESAISGIFAANKKILNKKNGSGSTIAMGLIENNKMQPVFAGDSIILVTGQRGRTKYINFPHSPVGYLYRGGIGISDPKQLAPYNHIVSNLLGTQEMYIEVGPSISLSKNDTALICSDGLSDIMATKDIINSVRSGTLEQAANNLLKNVKRLTQTEYVEHDDITFCLLRRNK